jgi:hypothetical protein
MVEYFRGGIKRIMNRNNIIVFFRSAAVFFIAACVFLLTDIRTSASDESETDISAEVIDAVVNETEGTATVNVKVDNKGADFGGYVRLRFTDITQSSRNLVTVYETYVSVASGTEEETWITFATPDGADLSKAELRLQIVDEKDKIVWSAKQYRIFDTLKNSYGVLSDHPDKLYYFENISYMQKELTASDAEDMNKLSVIRFLVIDDYDTTQLSKKAVSNIESWVNSGGILIIGTGHAMDKTFCNFDQRMIDITIGTRGVKSVPSYYGDYNMQTGDNDYLDCADLKYGYSYSSNTQSFDLTNTYNFYDWPEKSYGSGIVNVYPFALGDPDLSTDYIISQCETPILYGNSNNNYGYSGHNGIAGWMDDIFDIFQGQGSVNVVLLSIIICLYVVIVGPVLYLILKKMNKREKMWAIIPAISVFTVFLVFIISRTFGISERALYSVRVLADSNSKEQTFIYGYNSKSKEWGFDVSDEAEAASYYYTERWNGTTGKDETNYSFKSSFSPDGKHVSIVPGSVYEQEYFRVVSEPLTDMNGTLSAEIYGTLDTIEGTVTNDTALDFDYFLIVADGLFIITDGADAGQTVKVSEKYMDYNVHNVLNFGNSKKNKIQANQEKYREYAALTTATEVEAMRGNANYVIGVRKENKSIVSSKIKNTIYLCCCGDVYYEEW